MTHHPRLFLNARVATHGSYLKYIYVFPVSGGSVFASDSTAPLPDLIKITTASQYSNSVFVLATNERIQECNTYPTLADTILNLPNLWMI